MATQSNEFRRNFDRGKTAISRNNFSTPVQHLLESGLLTKRRSFFDYGCGRGDDVAGLAQLGFSANGWDPEYASENKRSSADIVNLGYVLNVIENTGERLDTLRSAWGIANHALIVTVISSWNQPKAGLACFGDGAVTQRGTFQRYYQPGELKEYVDGALGVDSLPVSPTSVICFRDSDTEQEYLARSSSLSQRIIPSATHPLRKTRLRQSIEVFRSKYPEDWSNLIEWALRYGIAPPEKMVRRNSALIKAGVHGGDVLAATVEAYGEEQWAKIVDIIRHAYVSRIALGFFRGTPRPNHFTPEDRLAIKLHFGSFDSAKENGRSTLFAIGDPRRVAISCASARVGFEDEQALYVHRSAVALTDALLQTYIGAGRLFYGSLDDVDIFKIHKGSGKLTLLLYDNFDAEDQPALKTRIKIDFRSRRIRFFDHSREHQRLPDKSRYLPAKSSLY